MQRIGGLEGRYFCDMENMDRFMELELINGTGGNYFFHHCEIVFHCLLPPRFQAFWL